MFTGAVCHVIIAVHLGSPQHRRFLMYVERDEMISDDLHFCFLAREETGVRAYGQNLETILPQK